MAKWVILLGIESVKCAIKIQMRNFTAWSRILCKPSWPCANKKKLETNRCRDPSNLKRISAAILISFHVVWSVHLPAAAVFSLNHNPILHFVEAPSAASGISDIPNFRDLPSGISAEEAYLATLSKKQKRKLLKKLLEQEERGEPPLSGDALISFVDNVASKSSKSKKRDKKKDKHDKSKSKSKSKKRKRHSSDSESEDKSRGDSRDRREILHGSSESKDAHRSSSTKRRRSRSASPTPKQDRNSPTPPS